MDVYGLLDHIGAKTGASARREGVASNGEPQWKIRCPAHDDRTASLAITTGDNGHPMLKCHAECDPTDVLAAVELGWADLGEWEDRSSATYPYTDENGVVLFVVQRGPKKRFRACGPNGETGLPEGVPRVLYNLPTVRAAIRDGGPVYVVEGEKDADSATAVGVVATTNPFGAGKWAQIHTEALRDAHVIIVEDDDVKGREHAETVENALRPVAASVVRKRAARGNDLTDHLRAGLGLSELLDADVFVGVVNLAQVQEKPLEWLWDGHIPLGKITFVEGDPGDGKTTAVGDLAARVSRGGSMPASTEPTKPGHVLLMTCEDDPEDTIVPRLRVAGADLGMFSLWQFRSTDLELPTLPRDIGRIENLIKAKGVRLVVIDPLMAYLDKNLSALNDQDVRRALSPLAVVAAHNRCAVVIIRHLTKGGGSNPLYRGSGSIGITGAARAGFLIARHPDDENRRILAPSKSNISAKASALTFTLVPVEGEAVTRVEWGEATEHTAAGLLSSAADDVGQVESCAEVIRDVLTGGDIRSNELRDRIVDTENFSAATYRRARKRLNLASDQRPTGKKGANEWWVSP